MVRIRHFFNDVSHLQIAISVCQVCSEKNSNLKTRVHMGFKDRLARFFAREGGTKEQIDNALKKELFKCGHPKYKVLEGKVRYWRILKKECYPGGCTSMDGDESFSISLPHNPLVKPSLLVPPDELDMFLKKDLKKFMGVLHAVKPRFDIKITQRKEVNFKGFILTFKECMIDNVFFNDFVYLLISEETQCEMDFAGTDTISGVGFFSMNEKGMLVLSRPEKLRIIAKGIEAEQVNKKLSHSMEFRLVDPYVQDICEVCPYSLVIRVRKRFMDHSSKTIKNKSTREFACTLGKCILMEEKERELEEKQEIEEENAVKLVAINRGEDANEDTTDNEE